MDIIPLTFEQKSRKVELATLLNDQNIDIRNDSDLCWDYIFHADRARIPDPERIVRMMQKAKYLHEYCNFQLGYELAQNETRETGKLHKENWLALLRKCVLATTKLKGYPETWPWITGISGDDWKREYDVSLEITKAYQEN